MSLKNYYTLLGISNTATANEIKTAYRELAKKYHPDKNHGNKSAEEYFKEIQQAYAILSNPEKRKKYDLKFFYGTVLAKQKTKSPYTGNAYQYAQQQSQQKHQFHNVKSVPKKKAKSESHQILISIGIALILLYFIISYNTRNKQSIPSQIPTNIVNTTITK